MNQTVGCCSGHGNNETSNSRARGCTFDQDLQEEKRKRVQEVIKKKKLKERNIKAHSPYPAQLKLFLDAGVRVFPSLLEAQPNTERAWTRHCNGGSGHTGERVDTRQVDNPGESEEEAAAESHGC